MQVPIQADFILELAMGKLAVNGDLVVLFLVCLSVRCKYNSGCRIVRSTFALFYFN